jgi:hypothetical protein
MVRKRITIGNKRKVVYSTKAQAERAKDKAPGRNRVRKVKQGWINERV